jgi:hypothetical protein
MSGSLLRKVSNRATPPVAAASRLIKTAGFKHGKEFAEGVVRVCRGPHPTGLRSTAQYRRSPRVPRLLYSNMLFDDKFFSHEIRKLGQNWHSTAPDATVCQTLTIFLPPGSAHI